MVRDVLFEKVTTGNGWMKMSYRGKCVGQPSTVQRQRDSIGYRIVELAGNSEVGREI